MAETNGQETIVTQPAPQPEPSYKKYSEQTGTEEWQNDLFDCFEGPDNLCLKGTFCSCFVYGKTKARLRDPTLAGYERINNDCLIFVASSLCCGWGPMIFQFLKRQEVRAKYNIRGDTVTDGLFSCFCGCCSIIQDEKEVIARQAGAGAGGYAKPEGMVAGPQN